MSLVKNKKVILVLFVTIVILLLAGLLVFSKKKCLMLSGSVEMVLKEDGFSPKDLDIAKCTRVVFKNEGTKPHWPASDLHPTHGIYPEFDPLEPIEPGQSWSFVFDKTGSWKYHDHLAPLFRGVISVK